MSSCVYQVSILGATTPTIADSSIVSTKALNPKQVLERYKVAAEQHNDSEGAARVVNTLKLMEPHKAFLNGKLKVGTTHFSQHVSFRVSRTLV